MCISSEFCVIETSIIDNAGLSWDELGFIVFLLGKPVGFKMSMEYLVKQTEASSKPVGDKRIKEMLKKAEKLGIISYTKDRGF